MSTTSSHPLSSDSTTSPPQPWEGRTPRILVCLTGSVATIKIYELTRLLSTFSDVRVVPTAASKHFFDVSKLEAELQPSHSNLQSRSSLIPHFQKMQGPASPCSPCTAALTADACSEAEGKTDAPPGGALKGTQYIFEDAHEWSSWKEIGDPVLHIELRRWADMMLFAPLDANTLAKLAAGLSDNLLTSTARAWPVGEKPFVVCPAMNTVMYLHPATQEHLDAIKRLYSALIIAPQIKKLACNDIGVGAMASVTDIAATVRQIFSSFQPVVPKVVRSVRRDGSLVYVGDDDDDDADDDCTNAECGVK